MIKKLFSYSGTYKKNAYNAVALILFSVLSEIAVFFMLYLMIDKLLQGADSISRICLYIIGMFIFYILKSLFFSYGLDQSHIFAFNTLFNIRKKFAEKLKRISLGSIMSKRTGSYRQNFVDDVESIELLLAHGIPEGLPYAIQSITVFIIIFILDYRMGLLSLVTIPLAMLAMRFMVKDGVERSNQYRDSLIKLNKSIIEYVSGMEVVKIFNKTAVSSKKINKSIKKYKEFTSDWYKGNYNYMAIYQSVLPSTIVAMLPLGMLMVINKTIALPVFLLCIILALSISTPLLKLMNYFPLLYNVVKKIEKLEEEFDQPEINCGTDNKNISSNVIEFKDVSFSYKDEKVLKDISFVINNNQKIGIVGESGSGKSTIGRLIMHYWDIQEGSILLGGTDIKDISLEKLMNKISYVSQDNFLFNMSIKENLLIAKPDATDDEIIEACKVASCHDVIMSLSNGYDTNVGDSGNKLSGGERQRITIARAILKNSDIVILDEATSFTDSENDYLINKAIENLSKNKTVITIAHKLSNIKNMDKILLVDKGELIAYSSHDNLLNNDTYKNLWDRYIEAKNYKIKVKE